MSDTIPDSFLEEFFKQATRALKDCSLEELDSDPTNIDIRKMLLEKQTNLLDSLARNNDIPIAELQAAVKSAAERSSTVKDASSAMNEQARRTFCRLVLQNECSLEESNRNLQKTGEIDDTKLFEFCGLCQMVVKLEHVLEYLKHGTPLYQEPIIKTILPHQRLERIQRMFLRSLNIDPDYGTKYIAKRFFQNTDPNEELQTMFVTSNRSMEAFLMDLTKQITAEMTDGTTRVVSVHYSERIVDKDGEERVISDAPQAERMDDQQQQKPTSSQQEKDLLLAKHAAQLQQELLHELLELSEEDRTAKLKEAHGTVCRVLAHVEELPGPQRIQYMLSLDADTQKLMAIKKLWDNREQLIKN